MRITWKICKHALDVGTYELHHTLLQHWVRNIDGKDDAGGVGLLGVSAVVLCGLAFVSA